MKFSTRQYGRLGILTISLDSRQGQVLNAIMNRTRLVQTSAKTYLENLEDNKISTLTII